MDDPMIAQAARAHAQAAAQAGLRLHVAAEIFARHCPHPMFRADGGVPAVAQELCQEAAVWALIAADVLIAAAQRRPPDRV